MLRNNIFYFIADVFIFLVYFHDGLEHLFFWEFLVTYPVASAWSIFLAYPGIEYMDTPMILDKGEILSDFLGNFNAGKREHIDIHENNIGPEVWARSLASSVSPQAATTLNLGSLSRIWVQASRTSLWSSAIKIRISFIGRFWMNKDCTSVYEDRQTRKKYYPYVFIFAKNIFNGLRIIL